MIKLLKGAVAAALLSAWTPALAQSTATPVIPGYLTTAGCPSWQTSCFMQYGVGGGGGGTAGVVTSFAQTTTASDVALAAHAYQNGVVITAAITNLGTAYVGGSGVTTGTGYPLAAGQSISYGVTNSNQVHLIGSDTSEVVNVTGN